MKKCTICLCVKPYSDFHKQAGRKDGYANWCKPCKKVKKANDYAANREQVLARCAEYREANPDKVSAAKKRCYQAKRDQYLAQHKAHYEANKERALATCKKYYTANKERIAERAKEYRARNRTELLAKQSEYQKLNWARISKYQQAYAKARLKSDPIYAIGRLARRRISIALRQAGYAKSTRTHEMLGCDYSHLVLHLESQFKDGMTWENRGEWHIDHIIPLASAKTEEEIIALCHYTNLQPLWAFENLSKGARMPDIHMMGSGNVRTDI